MKGDNSLFGAIDDLKAFLMSLKHHEDANYEKAWEHLLRCRENAIQHYLYMNYEIYGAEELKSMGLTEEECRQNMFMGLHQAVMRFQYDDEISESKNLKKFIAYTNIYLDTSLKRAIEIENGVTKYYSGLLLRLKKLCLDLWESPMEELCAGILTSCFAKNCKDPEALIMRMREYFKRLKSEELSTAYAVEAPDMIASTEFEADLQAFRKKLYSAGGFEWVKIFNLYFVEDHSALSTAAECGLSANKTRKCIELIRDMAKAEFAPAIRKKQVKSFIMNGNDIDIDGLITDMAVDLDYLFE